jgi:prepilin-type N-terminal cleavage/methylation domain-containing protein
MDQSPRTIFRQYVSRSSAGFTVLELLTVIAIIGILSSVVVISFNRLRGPRNLVLARNELVTHIRQAQSYALSSRLTTNGTAAKFFALTIPSLPAASYSLDAIDSSYVVLSGMEQYTLPDTVRITQVQMELPAGTTLANPSCLVVVFGLPFGRMYVDGNTDSDGACDVLQKVQNPSELDRRSNGKVTITLTDSSSGQTKTIILQGISGAIEAP